MNYGQSLFPAAFLGQTHIAGHIGVGRAGGLAGNQGILFLHRGELHQIPNGTSGADLGAGTAKAAVRVGEQFVVQGAHIGFQLFFVVLQHTHAPQIAAGPHTAAAQHAAVHIVDEQRVFAVLSEALDAGAHAGGGNTHVLNQGLQLAPAVFGAGGAILRMGSQQQLHGQLAQVVDTRAVGGDLHALGCLQLAGGLHALHPLHLNDAQPAGAQVRQVGVVAQMGNIDPVLQGSFQQIHALGHGQLSAVNLDCNAHVWRSFPGLSQCP